jgi:hypothetical protein
MEARKAPTKIAVTAPYTRRSPALSADENKRGRCP